MSNIILSEEVDHHRRDLSDAASATLPAIPLNRTPLENASHGKKGRQSAAAAKEGDADHFGGSDIDAESSNPPFISPLRSWPDETDNVIDVASLLAAAWHW